MSKKVVIVGGGASGLMAAIQASRQGSKVTIMENMDRVGKKILSTGNGKCNLSSELVKPEFYFGGNKTFIREVLNNFPVSETKEFFENMGVLLFEKNKGIYPYSQQASTILNALRYKCQEMGVREVCDRKIFEIQKRKKRFLVGEEIFDSVILATGGFAAPKTGSDGSGIKIAKEMGHKIVKPVPALVGLNCEESFYKSLQGIRAFGKITIYIEDEPVAWDQGEIQLTSSGISGIPVFQISHHATRSLDKTKNIRCEIDFFPDMSDEELLDFLSKSISSNMRTPREHLACILNKKLAEVIYKESKTTEFMTLKDLVAIVNTAKHFQTKVVGSKGFEFAQVTSGGVDVKNINPHTMESLIVDDLYFAGEIMDINGLCGGFNLQWAWSTGYIAGSNAGKEKKYDSN